MRSDIGSALFQTVAMVSYKTSKAKRESSMLLRLLYSLDLVSELKSC